VEAERDEARATVAAVGAEKDELRARAEAAEHRRSAAEHRATRIQLDKELLARAESAEARCRQLEDALRDASRAGSGQ
jgi:hypothetical protein